MMVRSRLTRGKYIPPLKRYMSRSMRSRQIALRRLSRSRLPAAKGALNRIRYRAKSNLRKLRLRLSGVSRVRGAVRKFKARMVVRRGMRKFALRSRVKNLSTLVRLSRHMYAVRNRKR